MRIGSSDSHGVADKSNFAGCIENSSHSLEKNCRLSEKREERSGGLKLVGPENWHFYCSLDGR
jgi:hypothetical protein